MATRGHPIILKSHNWGTKMIEVVDPPVHYMTCQGEACNRIIPESNCGRNKKYCSKRCGSLANKRASGVPRTTKHYKNYLR